MTKKELETPVINKSKLQYISNPTASLGINVNIESIVTLNSSEDESKIPDSEIVTPIGSNSPAE
jgi:hypothetical protein